MIINNLDHRIYKRQNKKTRIKFRTNSNFLPIKARRDKGNAMIINFVSNFFSKKYKFYTE
jgi:hypothetical protein